MSSQGLDPGRFTPKEKTTVFIEWEVGGFLSLFGRFGKEVINSRIHFFFYIRGSVHCNSRLKKSNEMQKYAGI